MKGFIREISPKTPKDERGRGFRVQGLGCLGFRVLTVDIMACVTQGGRLEGIDQSGPSFPFDRLAQSELSSQQFSSALLLPDGSCASRFAAKHPTQASAGTVSHSVRAPCLRLYVGTRQKLKSLPLQQAPQAPQVQRMPAAQLAASFRLRAHRQDARTLADIMGLSWVRAWYYCFFTKTNIIVIIAMMVMMITVILLILLLLIIIIIGDKSPKRTGYLYGSRLSVAVGRASR